MGVKVFGSDLREIERIGLQLEEILKQPWLSTPAKRMLRLPIGHLPKLMGRWGMLEPAC